MNLIQLLICLILHRKSQKQIAEELVISRKTLNRLLKEGKAVALHKIEPNILDDVMQKYAMPKDFSPSASVRIVIPPCSRHELSFIMDKLNTVFTGTDLELNFRMQEIRKYLDDGTEYDEGKVTIAQWYFETAKTKLNEFELFMAQTGSVPTKYHYWIGHTKETIKILESAAGPGLKASPEALKSGVRFVFDLKTQIDAISAKSIQKTSELKHALEFLLITSAAQTAEILVEGGHPEYVADMTNIIANTFGKYQGDSFKHLMVKSAWQHNQPIMQELCDQHLLDSNGLTFTNTEDLKVRNVEICNAIDLPKPLAA